MIGRAKIKRLAREIVSLAGILSGYYSATQLLPNGVRILGYHSVNERPTNSFAVFSSIFEKQMQILVEEYTILSLERIVELLQVDRRLPPRLVSITIDDGYRDAYTYAYPILKRLSIPATLFLPVEFIGTSSHEKLNNKLPASDFLSWQQVREMSDNGISFGSHSMSHLSLTKLTRKDVKYQLESSKARLEAEIGSPVTGLSYPYGTIRDFNPEIKRLAAVAGYSWAVTGISGINRPGSDLFALRRTKVERDDGMRIFRRAMKGALDSWVIIDRWFWFLQGRNR